MLLIDSEIVCGGTPSDSHADYLRKTPTCTIPSPIKERKTLWDVDVPSPSFRDLYPGTNIITIFLALWFIAHSVFFC